MPVPVFVVEKMKDPVYLESSWKQLSSQVRVDKVYIETYRSGTVADDSLLEAVKSYFTSRGVQVAGGIAYVTAGGAAGCGPRPSSGGGQFCSMCYTDPKQRNWARRVTEAELHARTAARNHARRFYLLQHQARRRHRRQRRGELVRAPAAQDEGLFRSELILEPARAGESAVKVIIKYPNWYEHFMASASTDREAHMFDDIYTGTETRDPVMTDQLLQQYESYLVFRYYRTIRPDDDKTTEAGSMCTPTVTSRSLRRTALGHDAGQNAADHALSIQRPAATRRARRSAPPGPP